MSSQTYVEILAFPTRSCVSFSKSLDLSEPQFPHLQVGMKSSTWGYCKGQVQYPVCAGAGRPVLSTKMALSSCSCGHSISRPHPTQHSQLSLAWFPHFQVKNLQKGRNQGVTFPSCLHSPSLTSSSSVSEGLFFSERLCGARLSFPVPLLPPCASSCRSAPSCDSPTLPPSSAL